MNKIKVLIIDDHQVIIDGISLMLANTPDVIIAGTASNALKGLESARELKPDVIVADISMPELNGIIFTEKILKEFPDIKVIILSMHTTEDFICSVIKAGAKGYLTKQATTKEELLQAIRTVTQGGEYFTKGVADVILKQYIHNVRKGASHEIKPASLTHREREILVNYARGYSNKEIADALCISIKTVEAHKNNIMQKFNFKSTVEMVKYAIRTNLADL